MNNSDNRKYLKFTDLDSLSRNIDEDYNGMLYAELCFSRYSMNRILKKYAGFPYSYKIHALIEHGVILTDYVGGAFRAHEYLPSIVSSKYRVDILKKEKNFNGAYAIGPFIHYVDSLLNSKEIKEEKERLGKTLLVFPSHSIDGNLSNFDYEKFCDNIKIYGADFDSVRICMYYKDIQLNRHEIYQKNGFEVVTAGHFNDYNFLSRLKSIIELSDMTMSNDIGTHLGYCIYLNKPHFLDLNQKIKYSAENDDKNSKLMINNINEFIKTQNKNSNFTKINELFSIYNTKITKDQYNIISYLWGFDEVKSPKELKKLILNINKDFSWIKYYLSGLTRMKNIIANGR